MPLHFEQPSLPSLSFTASTNHALRRLLHQGQSNSHDKVQNADIPSKLTLGVMGDC